jgi:ABC-type Fe3+/spermidine/putrescine transport system ATPase subunit
VWANPQSAYVAEFLGLGNIINGEVFGKDKFQTEHGIFTVKCNHKHSKGDKVKLLSRAERRADASPARSRSAVSGVVTDSIFQNNHYKVTLDNGLYVYLDESPKIGKRISVKVKVECLA